MPADVFRRVYVATLNIGYPTIVRFLYATIRTYNKSQKRGRFQSSGLNRCAETEVHQCISLNSITSKMKKKSNEYVIVAHIRSPGYGSYSRGDQIYNGADDNLRSIGRCK